MYFAPLAPALRLPPYRVFMARVPADEAPAAPEDDGKPWTVSLDVPGVSREDLSIELEDQILRVQTREEAPRRYRQAWQLPKDIDLDGIEARLENGVLTLTLPRAQPQSRGRKIPLN